MIPKHTRWESEDYLKFVSELPCANCHIKDDTIVAHHLKHIYSPYSGGAGLKASDTVSYTHLTLPTILLV